LYKAGRSEKNPAKSLKLGCRHGDGQHASINYVFSLRISRILNNNNNRVYGAKQMVKHQLFADTYAMVCKGQA
jgi:hypothetical protein